MYAVQTIGAQRDKNKVVTTCIDVSLSSLIPSSFNTPPVHHHTHTHLAVANQPLLQLAQIPLPRRLLLPPLHLPTALLPLAG